MEVGRAIGYEREKPERDSERERVRVKMKKRQMMAIIVVVGFVGALSYLIGKAGVEWYKWATTKEETVIIAREPTIEIIDEATGKDAKVSSRVREYVAKIEEEFGLLGRTVVRARIPAGKIREIDLEIEGVSGIIRTSLDRGATVSAEDGERMIRYLEQQGVGDFQYIDVRVARKGYYK